jgi:hypothetical protein
MPARKRKYAGRLWNFQSISVRFHSRKLFAYGIKDADGSILVSNPDTAIGCFEELINVFAGKRRLINVVPPRIELETVVTSQDVFGTEPHKPFLVAEYAAHFVGRQAINRVQATKFDVCLIRLNGYESPEKSDGK